MHISKVTIKNGGKVVFDARERKLLADGSVVLYDKRNHRAYDPKTGVEIVLNNSQDRVREPSL